MPFEKGTFIEPNVASPNYKDSSRYGFRVRWPVASDYQIVDGLLISKPSAGWQDSYPITQENIPTQLAKIKEGDEKALLAFARRYGNLGFTNLLPLPVSLVKQWGRAITVSDVLAGPVGHTHLTENARAELLKTFLEVQLERLGKNQKAIREIGIDCGLTDKRIWRSLIAHRGGDPLPWIWAHIRALNICCTLTDYIQDEDEELAFSYLKQFDPGLEVRGSMECEMISTCDVAFAHRVARQAWFKPTELKDWSVLDFSKFIRRQLINKNIEGIRIAIEPIGKGESSFLEYRSLIEVAYWHLHNRVIDGRMKRCRECGAFFVQKDKRETFCPEPRTPKGESRCAVLNRSTRNMKKHREKLKRNQKPKK